MNGVIHNCSHGAGTDVNTRMTEDEVRFIDATRAKRDSECPVAPSIDARNLARLFSTRGALFVNPIRAPRSALLVRSRSSPLDGDRTRSRGRSITRRLRPRVFETRASDTTRERATRR
jgi:hypothetical protein